MVASCFMNSQRGPKAGFLVVWSSNLNRTFMNTTVEWVDCAIVRPHSGLHGASPLYLAVPKTLMPVKTYAHPNIHVNTDGITDFAWGVSYGPVTQDIMRVVDTLSHAPRDSSPAIGFWDKVRMIFSSSADELD